VDAKGLAEKSLAKVALAGAEKDRQKTVAADNTANSGDLTRYKIGKLIEMLIDDA
jgi:hypothetical protein